MFFMSESKKRYVVNSKLLSEMLPFTISLLFHSAYEQGTLYSCSTYIGYLSSLIGYDITFSIIMDFHLVLQIQIISEVLQMMNRKIHGLFSPSLIFSK